MSLVIQNRVAIKGADCEGDEDEGIEDSEKEFSDAEGEFDVVLVETVGHSEHVDTGVGHEGEDVGLCSHFWEIYYSTKSTNLKPFISNFTFSCEKHIFLSFHPLCLSKFFPSNPLEHPRESIDSTKIEGVSFFEFYFLIKSSNFQSFYTLINNINNFLKLDKKLIKT